jgi:hypothetical protein
VAEERDRQGDAILMQHTRTAAAPPASHCFGLFRLPQQDAEADCPPCPHEQACATFQAAVDKRLDALLGQDGPQGGKGAQDLSWEAASKRLDALLAMITAR